MGPELKLSKTRQTTPPCRRHGNALVSKEPPRNCPAVALPALRRPLWSRSRPPRLLQNCTDLPMRFHGGCPSDRKTKYFEALAEFFLKCLHLLVQFDDFLIYIFNLWIYEYIYRDIWIHRYIWKIEYMRIYLYIRGPCWIRHPTSYGCLLPYNTHGHFCLMRLIWLDTSGLDTSWSVFVVNLNIKGFNLCIQAYTHHDTTLTKSPHQHLINYTRDSVVVFAYSLYVLCCWSMFVSICLFNVFLFSFFLIVFIHLDHCNCRHRCSHSDASRHEKTSWASKTPDKLKQSDGFICAAERMLKQPVPLSPATATD